VEIADTAAAEAGVLIRGIVLQEPRRGGGEEGRREQGEAAAAG
jgi:hypothetical protein